MRRGIAAEMNSAFAVRARMIRSPNCRAALLSGGNCSLCFTIADCAPAVERPSSHSHASMTPRNSATSALLSTFGTQISIVGFSPRMSRLELGLYNPIGGPARRDENERRRALVERVVVSLVEDVVDGKLGAPVLVDFVFDEGGGVPVFGQHGALVCRKQRAAVDFGCVNGLAADLEVVGELVLGQRGEGLMGNVGELVADIGEHHGLGDIRLHQHQSAEYAPTVGDLAGYFEIDALNVTGRTRRDRTRARQSGRDRFAGILCFGPEQRGGREKMPVEQLPLGPDFVGLVALRTKYLAD